MRSGDHDNGGSVGWEWLVVIVGVAVGVRVLGVAALWDDALTGDSEFYSAQARLVAEGEGFVRPFPGSAGGEGGAQSADHPPLFTMYLAAWSLLGAETEAWHRLASSALGVLTVLLVVRVGVQLGGRRAGIVAGLFAAVWPNLWYWEIDVQAEAIAAPCVAAFSLVGLRFLDRPNRKALVSLGVTVGLAALARAELVLLAAAVPVLALALDGLSRLGKVQWIGVSLVATVVTIAPWSVYNLARFDRPVLLSNGLGLVLVSSNCDSTYYGENIGYWWFGCSKSGSLAAGLIPDLDDQSDEDVLKRGVALEYIADHVDRVPAVMTARALRYMGLWPPLAAADRAESSEALPRSVYYVAQGLWLGALGFGIVAIRTGRRAGRRLLPVLAPPVVGLTTAIFVYGILRFRAPTEPPLIALGAWGLVLTGNGAAGWVRSRRRASGLVTRTASQTGQSEQSMPDRLRRVQAGR